jgi:cytochrome c-type biogenesis protein
MSLSSTQNRFIAPLMLLLIAALTSSWLIFPYLFQGKQILSQTGQDIKLQQLEKGQTVSQFLSRRFITPERHEITGTFAAKEYFESSGQLQSMQLLEADTHHVFFIAESVHTGKLPKRMPDVTLLLPDNTNIKALSVTGPSEADHHRSLTVKFPKLNADGSPTIPDNGDPFRIVVQNFFDNGKDYVAWLEWHFPILLPDAVQQQGFTTPWLAILLAIGLLSSVLTPCMLQLSVVYFAVLTGSGALLQQRGSVAEISPQLRREIILFAVAFILGFVLLFAGVGALIGWSGLLMQAYLGLYSTHISIAAGVVVVAFGVYLAYQANMPLACKLPMAKVAAGIRKHSILSSAVLAVGYSLGCITCFGGAIIGTLLVYIGTLDSPLLGAGIMAAFALGVGIPFLLAAILLGKSQQLMNALLKWQKPIQYFTALVVLFFGLVLLTDNYHVLSDWLYPWLGLEDSDNF